MTNQLDKEFKQTVDLSKDVIRYLDKNPFILMIGKYDHVLGPRALFSPIEIGNDQFIKNLLRDALNTKNKFVILNYNKFYSQICKVKIRDENARGKKQLYAIILLRHIDLPLLPTIHFKKIEMLFRKIGEKKILQDDLQHFSSFFDEIKEIYINKNEIVPLESCNLKIRSGVNTIQGFCELILEEKRKNGKISEDSVLTYTELMLDSCDDIIEALEKDFQSSFKG
jgi:hypothetical protein